MRHRRRGNRLSRLSNHRRATLRNLARALILEGRIRTTEAKAKALRPFLEPLVSFAKEDTLANRRLVARRFGNDPEAVKRLFEDVAPRYKDRPGGYFRIVKLAGFRRGDAARRAEVLWT